MSRVIIFSRVFPSYHPRKGEATHFVEQLWNSLRYLNLPVPKNKDLPHDFLWSILPLSNYGMKHHTIRAGNRWKVGDKFSPRIWSGKPYRSKQIIIGPDIEVKKVWEVIIDEFHNVSIPHKDKKMGKLGYRMLIPAGDVAQNDGLSFIDFKHWFAKPFSGQIICWNENINY